MYRALALTYERATADDLFICSVHPSVMNSDTTQIRHFTPDDFVSIDECFFDLHTAHALQTLSI